MQITCIWQGPAALGEGPLWHPAEEVLYFIDIAKKKLHRLDPETGAHQAWVMPDFIGAIVPRAKQGVMATVGQHVVSVDAATGEIRPIVKVIPDGRADLRMNDGKCDRLGRFWIGVANLDVQNPQGGLFCLDVDGSLSQRETGITISNGLGFSPDDKTFYYTDGLKYRVYAYDFDLSSGTLSNRRVFLQYEPSSAEPDGLTVDSAGYVWEAMWGNGKVYRYAPDGCLDATIEMPVVRPTSCIIGGRNYDTLYVTSCSQGIGESEILASPAGGVFAIPLQVPGLPEPVFSEST